MADLLVVCRGNLCRSPAAELLLRDALGPDSGLTVRSAGLRPALGAAVPDDVATWLQARGLDPGQHVPRAVDRASIDSADLVVVMTRSQRSAIVSTVPAALRRTLLLTEVADRVATDPAGAVLVGPGPGPAPDDLTDPWGRPTADVVAILERLEHEVARMVPPLRHLGPRHTV